MPTIKHIIAYAYPSLLFVITVAIIYFQFPSSYPINLETISLATIAIIFALFVILLGFPAPSYGHVSLDRIAQVSMLLAFGPLYAALMNGIASFIYPFAAYPNYKSTIPTTIQAALHNSAMTALMLLGGGWLYQYFGGEFPLSAINPHNALVIAISALVIQVINHVLMAIRIWLEGHKFSSGFVTFSTIIEMASIPVAVLTALFYAQSSISTFILFITVLLSLIIIVRQLIDTHHRLQFRLKLLEALNRTSIAINSSLIISELGSIVYEECKRLLSFDTFYFALINPKRNELQFVQAVENQKPVSSENISMDSGLLGWTIKQKKPLFIPNWSKTDPVIAQQAILDGELYQSFIAVPIIHDKKALGVISVQSSINEAFDESHLQLFKTLANQIAISLVNAKLYQQVTKHKEQLEEKVTLRTTELKTKQLQLSAANKSLEAAINQKQLLVEELREKSNALARQSREDSLTGLYNRRHMDIKLEAEVARAKRFNHPLSVAMVDLDHFKKINDDFSHMLGDKVLQKIAEIFKAYCRNVDLVARYGGEEFVICLPETDNDTATLVCERLRQAVKNYEWKSILPDRDVTVSIGIITAPPCDYDAHTLLEQADYNLYRAKNSGRNKVVSGLENAIESA